MSDVQSLSSSTSSPLSTSSSVGLMGSSVTWEKVTLSPLEMLSVQLEHELQHAREGFSAVKQNKNGVDVDTATGKAAGRIEVHVIAAQGLESALTLDPMAGTAQPSVFVSTMVTPLSAFEKSTKKHLRTNAVAIDASNGSSAHWKECLLYEGVKSKTFSIKVTVSNSSSVIADVVLGEVELNSSLFLDQLPHEQWFELQAPASAAISAPQSLGKVLLRITFKYDSLARHEQRIAALEQRKKESDENVEQYKKTARQINASVQHPAAFGTVTAKSALYIPGNAFHIEAHHPGAVSVAPLPDKNRVITPFGRGEVISFRKESKMYVVQLDAATAAKNPSLAYLRQDIVKEEPEEPHIRMYMKVTTPYGQGLVEEIRADGIVVVKNEYARLYLQKRDVQVPEKSIEEMSTKDLIAEAITLTDKGNEQFRTNQLEEAVYNYLRSLGYLQRVNQDTATHKEKATMLQTMIRCHLNISACKLKLDAHYDAEIASTNALSILTVLHENRHGNVVTWMGRLGLSEKVMFEEWPAKARFRRAQACVKLEKYHDAKQDLMIAVKLNPTDKSCRQLLDKVTKTVKKQKLEEKKTWGGIFENIDADDVFISGSNDNAGESTTKTSTASTSASSDSTSIFTHKNKKQRAREAQRQKERANATKPWYLSRQALAAASILTAGVAVATIVAMKQKRS